MLTRTSALQEMKLFEIAMSLADVLLCLPGALTNRESMQIGPRDVLGHLVHFLAGFRGGGDRARLQLLYNKTYNSSVPGVIEHYINWDTVGIRNTNEVDTNIQVGVS
jgi:hypothetical protein